MALEAAPAPGVQVVEARRQLSVRCSNGRPRRASAAPAPGIGGGAEAPPPARRHGGELEAGVVPRVHQWRAGDDHSETGGGGDSAKPTRPGVPSGRSIVRLDGVAPASCSGPSPARYVAHRAFPGVRARSAAVREQGCEARRPAAESTEQRRSI